MSTEPVLISIDWGTTSFRAHLLTATGSSIDQHHSNRGILTLQSGEHREYLNSVIAAWRKRPLPVLMSGMITSRNGWQETAYLPAPAGIADFASALCPLESDNSAHYWFVTGTSCETDASYPDVLRGEECEVLGHVANSLHNTGLFILPGTHSKWVQIVDGNIAAFHTCMTGELFALLREHSILGKTMCDAEFNPAAFERGVQAARSNSNLLNSLFSTRTLALFNRLTDDQGADYLSGLLIGYEILHSRSLSDDSVTVIGRGDLCERYVLALQSYGLDCNSANTGMAQRGHIAIARAAGVIT